MSVTLNLAAGVRLTVSPAIARALQDQLEAHHLPPTGAPLLADNDPIWAAHSGGSGHVGPEWQPEHADAAYEFLRTSKPLARHILYLLIDNAGRRVSVDDIIASAPGVLVNSHSVAAALRGLASRPDGLTFPFRWWRGVQGRPTLYAVKQSVGRVFRTARERLENEDA